MKRFDRSDDAKKSGPMLFDNEIERPVDVHEIAKFLGANPNTVRAWCSTGRVAIPYFKLGNRLMFLRSQVTQWCSELSKGQH